MRRTVIAMSFSLIASLSAAKAHPEPAILQAGGAETRVALSGASVDYEKGVHLYRGRLKLAGEASPATPPSKTRAAITVNVKAWRPMRGLRTHGFFSGDPYPSRRYTQGFYSGR